MLDDYERFENWKCKLKMLGENIEGKRNPDRGGIIQLDRWDTSSEKVIIPKFVYIVNPLAFRNCENIREFVVENHINTLDVTMIPKTVVSVILPSTIRNLIGIRKGLFPELEYLEVKNICTWDAGNIHFKGHGSIDLAIIDEIISITEDMEKLGYGANTLHLNGISNGIYGILCNKIMKIVMEEDSALVSLLQTPLGKYALTPLNKERYQELDSDEVNVYVEVLEYRAKPTDTLLNDAENDILSFTDDVCSKTTLGTVLGIYRELHIDIGTVRVINKDTNEVVIEKGIKKNIMEE